MRTNTLLYTAIFMFSIFNFSCESSSVENNSTNGYATGLITDTNGQPIAGVEVAIENTLVGYHSTANGVTDTNGRYKIQLATVGTYHASAYLNKQFNGKQYKLELHCDQNDAFGNEGAVRNFQWKLSGAKPIAIDGFYGATLELYNEPGYYIDENDIIVTLTPVGSLIDGSTGNTLVSSPVVTSYSVVNDIPLGTYTVSATYNGTSLKLKKLDSNQAYGETSNIEFEQEISTGTPLARLSYNQ
ncbi:carboxypeptidase family protein [Gelidibacter algens]|uniref:Carboxypeptidase family protein n=2 Tax=Gelidibacter algens TaxID=49280 RepID=A0A327RT98_9FLAO|nr:carboxypeptidase-like regulatory domain-containing protein [Gelidibacter algens]RAJ20009.1 carboxypeptidase family protein [Gelidibacter algens]